MDGTREQVGKDCDQAKGNCLVPDEAPQEAVAMDTGLRVGGRRRGYSGIW